jgi:hypothetical protein
LETQLNEHYSICSRRHQSVVDAVKSALPQPASIEDFHGNVVATQSRDVTIRPSKVYTPDFGATPTSAAATDASDIWWPRSAPEIDRTVTSRQKPSADDPSTTVSQRGLAAVRCVNATLPTDFIPDDASAEKTGDQIDHRSSSIDARLQSSMISGTQLNAARANVTKTVSYTEVEKRRRYRRPVGGSSPVCRSMSHPLTAGPGKRPHLPNVIRGPLQYELLPKSVLDEMAVIDAEDSEVVGGFESRRPKTSKTSQSTLSPKRPVPTGFCADQDVSVADGPADMSVAGKASCNVGCVAEMTSALSRVHDAATRSVRYGIRPVNAVNAASALQSRVTIDRGQSVDGHELPTLIDKKLCFDDGDKKCLTTSNDECLELFGSSASLFAMPTSTAFSLSSMESETEWLRGIGEPLGGFDNDDNGGSADWSMSSDNSLFSLNTLQG